MSEAPADAALAFRLISTERLGGAFRPLDKVTVAHDSLSGGRELTVSREVMRAGTAAVIIPYDPVRDAIVAIRQFRIGAALATPFAAPLELPAGLLDEGEDAATAARRELAEETGLAATAIEEAFAILSSPGLCDEKAVVFLALVDASALAGSAGLAAENEDIVPAAFAVDALVAAADEGRILNGFLFASLQWFARKGRERAQAMRAHGHGEQA
ncbi:NUDIX domain-containing protein [Aureimonas populi]|uniref:GDP-mannose pyrophosphatase n=1 Tax=Aureimonas populi TaxID=1701758 RepID=A0ABW5CQ04_9HYPH|nr:NUDIX domain-containing protein [Aureimonas populi]